MKWAHLPVAGGVYDQDPELLRKWNIIHAEVAKVREAEMKRHEAQAKQSRGNSGGRRRAR